MTRKLLLACLILTVTVLGQGKLQIRRYTTTSGANAYTPTNGEPVWDGQAKTLRVGDGVTAGGVLVGPGGSGSVSNLNTLTSGSPLLGGGGAGVYSTNSAGYLGAVGALGVDSGSTTVATLPAGSYRSLWCSDVITPNGIGGYVEWNGVNWVLSRERIVASSVVFQFLTNAWKAKWWGVAKRLDGDMYENRLSSVSASGTTLTTGANSWAGWVSSRSNGIVYGFSTGTTTNGSGGALYQKYDVSSTDQQVFLIACTFLSVSTLCNDTETYWAAVGISSSTTAGVYPSSGAFLLYDRQRLYSTASPASSSNNWICVTGKVGTYEYNDSGVAVLDSINTTNACVYLTYSNAVFNIGNSWITNSTSASLPTNGVFAARAGITKTAGTTSRNFLVGSLYSYAFRTYDIVR